MSITSHPKKLVWALRTSFNLWRNRKKGVRLLEIGPGGNRIPGFETLNIVGSEGVDYVWDAASTLPFKDGIFDVVYASHILEHIPWYQTVPVLADWVRVVKLGGQLEIWVPNALKICETLVDFELRGEDHTHKDGWYRFNPEKDPCKWAAGRVFTYGDGRGSPCSPNWHRALFTPRYLKLVLEAAGLKQVRELDVRAVRGYDHGWINLGMMGVK